MVPTLVLAALCLLGAPLALAAGTVVFVPTFEISGGSPNGTLVGVTRQDYYSAGSPHLYRNGVLEPLPQDFFGQRTYWTDVNDAGTVVGYYVSWIEGEEESGPQLVSVHSVQRLADGTVTEDGYRELPIRINNAGQILFESSVSEASGTRWRLPGDSLWSDMNESGQVCGQVWDGAVLKYRAAIFQAGVVTYIDPPGVPGYGEYQNGFATGINDAGECVGWTHQHGPCLFSHGAIIPIPGHGNSAWSSQDITNSGEIIGTAQSESRIGPFVWHSNGTGEYLDVPYGSWALRMDGDVIAGTYQDEGTGLNSAWIYTSTVIDSEPPSLSNPTVSQGTLWPPNHRMVDVVVSYTAADNDRVADVALTATSSEPDNGLGDGDTAGDIQVVHPNLIRLRAERSGRGTGRIYTLQVTVTDASGNQTSKTVTVTVPHSQKK